MNKCMGDLISVIIPVYNREQYLDKCISSVLKQSDVKTEIILIDDGSTDNSPEIVDKYAQNNTNIVVVHQKNQGVSAARNAGLDVCSGDYIFFLDSDDSLPEDSLYTLLNAITEFNTDICIGNYCRFYENGELEYQNKIPDNLKNKIITPTELLSLMYVEYSHLCAVVTGKLYKRYIFDKIRFPYGTINEDEYILSDVVETISNAYLLDKNVYEITISKKSIMRSELSFKNLDFSVSVLRNLNYFLDKRYYDFALFRFGYVTRQLIEWKNNTQDVEIQNKIYEQYKLFRSIAIRLMPHVNFMEKIRLVLFCINFNLYAYVRNFLRK